MAEIEYGSEQAKRASGSRLNQARSAVRKKLKARIALDGPTGAGKTWSALVVAKELVPGGKILLIDTERRSSELYADNFEFDTVPWNPPYNPVALAETLLEAHYQYDVVIIDSLSHFWKGEGGTLDIVDNASSRVKNKFAAWKSGDEAQDYLINSLLSTDCHVIATMRSKMAYVEQEDDRGRKTMQKIGLQPIQRDGLEYEFTIVGDLDLAHRLAITKSRCHPVADKTFPAGRAGELGATLREWLAGGADDPVELVAARLRTMTRDERRALRESLGLTTLTPTDLMESPALVEQVADALERLDASEEEAKPETPVESPRKGRKAKADPEDAAPAAAPQAPAAPAEKGVSDPQEDADDQAS